MLRVVVAGAAVLRFSLPLWPAVAAGGEEERTSQSVVLVVAVPFELL
jgi:hypothetical protein